MQVCGQREQGRRAGWVVRLDSPEEQQFSGKSLEEALAGCLVWLMAKGTGHPKGLDWGRGTGYPTGRAWGHEGGSGPFLIRAST